MTTTSQERALAYALDDEGCRRGRPLTKSAILRADRAMRDVLRMIAFDEDCAVEDLSDETLSDWACGADMSGDTETLLALWWRDRRLDLIAAEARGLAARL